jgi:hypothetical protein
MLNDSMIMRDELEKDREGSWCNHNIHLPLDEEYHEKPQLGQLVSRTSQI